MPKTKSIAFGFATSAIIFTADRQHSAEQQGFQSFASVPPTTTQTYFESNKYSYMEREFSHFYCRDK
jgi:hypothetical protein